MLWENHPELEPEEMPWVVVGPERSLVFWEVSSACPWEEEPFGARSSLMKTKRKKVMKMKGQHQHQHQARKGLVLLWKRKKKRKRKTSQIQSWWG